MLSNQELTERLEIVEHELKIMKKIVNMGNLEQIPPADYELDAEPVCPHSNTYLNEDEVTVYCEDCSTKMTLEDYRDRKIR